MGKIIAKERVLDATKKEAITECSVNMGKIGRVSKILNFAGWPWGILTKQNKNKMSREKENAAKQAKTDG